MTSECGGTISGDIYIVTYDYKEENGYLYVYQYAGYGLSLGDSFKYTKLNDSEVKVDFFEGNEDKFSTLIWTFDKDYNFVSTKVTN